MAINLNSTKLESIGKTADANDVVDAADADDMTNDKSYPDIQYTVPDNQARSGLGWRYR